jgi:SAM-dependent methyltransferase
MNHPNCPLCNSSSVSTFSKNAKAEYFSCSVCEGIFLSADYFLSKDDELRRYNQHNNDINDVRYRKFTEPFVTAVMNDFGKNDIGLDFGAGPGPVISKVLTEKGYHIRQYDPFYHNDPDLLTNQYDYIVCCEVVEHFNHPRQEFMLLKNLLKSGGKLYVKTALYSPEIDFKKWHYRNDPTHVFFYRESTLGFIKDHLGFSQLEMNEGIIIYTH